MSLVCHWSYVTSLTWVLCHQVTSVSRVLMSLLTSLYILSNAAMHSTWQTKCCKIPCVHLTGASHMCPRLWIEESCNRCMKIRHVARDNVWGRREFWGLRTNWEWQLPVALSPCGCVRGGSVRENVYNLSKNVKSHVFWIFKKNVKKRKNVTT